MASGDLDWMEDEIRASRKVGLPEHFVQDAEEERHRVWTMRRVKAATRIQCALRSRSARYRLQQLLKAKMDLDKVKKKKKLKTSQKSFFHPHPLLSPLSLPLPLAPDLTARASSLPPLRPQK